MHRDLAAAASATARGGGVPFASGIYIATHARGEEEQTISLERRRRGYGDDEAEWVLIWQMRR
jgi:hypothetical protein